MSHIVILGAGLGGTIMAYEMKTKLRRDDRLTVVNLGSTYSFVPSNPWVAVGWRQPAEIEVDLAPVLKQRGIELRPEGAKRVEPAENRIQLNDGTSIYYDYLIIATGPDLAFDEVPGLGPNAHTQSVCQTDHALQAKVAFDKLVKTPGPVVIGAVQGASCYGPAYEFAFILETALRNARVRDRVPMTFVTPEPYIGHLGLDGVGDTKGLIESAMRDRHIKWITNARTTKVEPEKLVVEEVNDDGTVKATHELPFAFSMLLPAFRGVPAVLGVEGLTNPRGFIVIDKHQRNPTFPNVFGVGVCVAIPPVGKTPLAVGVPKTGFMIESMVTATAENIASLLKGEQPKAVATWNAVCLADFGDDGIAFVAQPQIPPRNVNWSSQGKWVHAAKIGFEKYFLRKVRQGKAETFYENLVLDMLGIKKLKEIHVETAEQAQS
ncbi:MULTISPECIES: NAD(P)/FAD-dependent oxidoreductase [unclassified Nitrobacter]|uniref:NAD(P)/FAD-dependent oxidoreductase n=1 Tax=unclassified Nitrobacter TaxID=2620411 RepID=UPI000926633A|nr:MULTISPECIES: FAD/NAD(P)-binding oxidoreductase [unclassified Nitrobacter]MBN9149641.1 NAD(P)/FAD-dependent oxidoreductase [Nitrobacter sp.]OJV00688.1 MAG: pyridine nucleotide-disulfide oxidoreductase [Nitrobacter sp. 62-23]